MKAQTIATLGPAGSFSSIAARRYFPREKMVYASSIDGIFSMLTKRQADKAVVPVENMLYGIVAETLALLLHSPFMIEGEMVLPIHHCIAAGDTGRKEVQYIVSHRQAIAQCSHYLKKHYPKAKLIEVSSTSEAFNAVASGKIKHAAAIGLKESAQHFGLKVLAEKIEDNHLNRTRFLIIGKKDYKKTGKDKTSIVLMPKVDRPGLLYDLLLPFKENKVNLLMIESRPTGRKLGEYVFYVDLSGHREDAAVRKTFKELEKITKYKILGSYPKVM